MTVVMQAVHGDGAEWMAPRAMTLDGDTAITATHAGMTVETTLKVCFATAGEAYSV